MKRHPLLALLALSSLLVGIVGFGWISDQIGMMRADGPDTPTWLDPTMWSIVEFFACVVAVFAILWRGRISWRVAACAPAAAVFALWWAAWEIIISTHRGMWCCS